MKEKKIGETSYDAWAPAGGIWTPWAKPALFVHMEKCQLLGESLGDWKSIDVRWAPEPRRATALIVDLPGLLAARTGVALAAVGYRPVPLYNVTVGARPLVAVEPIGDCLMEGSAALMEMRIAADAPPAFLLDSKRLKPDIIPVPGHFDNRWMVTPQDFPSANMMLSRGIAEVIVVQNDDRLPLEDLAHVLLRWQKSGIRIRTLEAGSTRGVQDITVKEPSMFRKAWYRALALTGFRRNAAGGFGGMIPVPSAGGMG
jgi:hypothetical protein